MADKRYVVRVDAEGNITKVLEDADKSTKKLGKSTDKTSGKADKLGKSLKAVGAGFAIVAAGAAVAVKAFIETDAAVGRLDNSLKAANATAAERTKIQQAQNEAFTKWGITTEQSSNLLRELTDASGSATEAAEDFAKAQIISAQANISLVEST